MNSATWKSAYLWIRCRCLQVLVFAMFTWSFSKILCIRTASIVDVLKRWLGQAGAFLTKIKTTKPQICGCLFLSLLFRLFRLFIDLYLRCHLDFSEAFVDLSSNASSPAKCFVKFVICSHAGESAIAGRFMWRVVRVWGLIRIRTAAFNGGFHSTGFFF